MSHSFSFVIKLKVHIVNDGDHISQVIVMVMMLTLQWYVSLLAQMINIIATLMIPFLHGMYSTSPLPSS